MQEKQVLHKRLTQQLQNKNMDIKEMLDCKRKELRMMRKNVGLGESGKNSHDVETLQNTQKVRSRWSTGQLTVTKGGMIGCEIN